MSTPVPATTDLSHPIPGRECGSCTLCCKVYSVPEINKPAGKWCQHCKPGKGCMIHEALPAQCSAFNCLWRTEEAISPIWKPEKSKMVLTTFPPNNYVYVVVDPGEPSAWRKQPYYDQLRRSAVENLPKDIHVIVFVNDVATLILPDRDIPIGPMKPTDGISIRKAHGTGFAKYEATIVPGDASDPPS